MKTKNMSIETSAAGGALIKYFGAPAIIAALGAGLGFLLLWPRTIREAFIRFTSSIICSFVFGPMFALAAWAWWPELFANAQQVAGQNGVDPLYGVLMVASPFMVMAALVPWLFLGALMRWFDRRRDKDLGEIVQDAAKVVREARGAL